MRAYVMRSVLPGCWLPAGVPVRLQFDGVVVQRFGAQGSARSIYVADPDGFVVELRSYS